MGILGQVECKSCHTTYYYHENPIDFWQSWVDDSCPECVEWKEYTKKDRTRVYLESIGIFSKQDLEDFLNESIEAEQLEFESIQRGDLD
jgi:hypothetical protein